MTPLTGTTYYPPPKSVFFSLVRAIRRTPASHLVRKDAPAIITGLINTCWFAFKWSILAMLATVVVVGGYLYLRIDDELRRYAEGLLASHYSELHIQLGGASFEVGRGIMLRNLVISERRAAAPQTIVEVEELQLLGQFDLESLASGKPVVERVCIRSPRIHAVRNANGEWNIARLYPPPASDRQPPTIKVSGALVTIDDARCGLGKPVTLREVALTAHCVKETPAADPAERPHRTYQVDATVGGDLAEKFSLAATVQTATGACDAQMHVVALDLSSPVVKSMVRRSPQLASIAELTGKADVNLVARRDAAGTPSWEADFRVTGARIAIDGVPRAVSQIKAEGVATHERLLIRTAEAHFGGAKVVLAVDRRGWTAGAPLAMQARADRFTIDDSLVELLPPSVHAAWNRFSPAGEVSATLAAQFDGRKWKPNLVMQCHDVSFIDREKFNYRLTSGTGTLTVGDLGDGRGPVLEIKQLTAAVGGTRATVNGVFAGLPGLGARRALGGATLPPTGWLEVAGQNFAINDQLVDALDPKVRRVVDSLDAKGRFSFRWRFERTDPLGDPHTETDITFHNARVQFEKFPYPLTHIEGQAVERDGTWQFNNLVSRDASAPRVVQATGSCTKTSNGTHLLDLTFVCQQLPLDDTLRLALPAAHQETWAAVRPQSGRVNVVAHVQHHIGVDARPHVRLEIKPLPNVVSVEPKCFPYRLDNLQGTILVVNNEVILQHLRGEHGPTVFESDGRWVPNNQGGWTMQFDNLHVDRLAADYDLKRAVPTAVGKVIEHLKPVGTFSIYDGTVRFSRDVAGSTHLRSDWKVSLGCQQNDLELGVPLKSISGAVHLAGRHEGNLRFTAGQLELDSVFWNGMQFTNVRGPLWVDTDECRLGREATRRMNVNNGKQDPLERIEASFYGGKLALDAGVQLSTGSRYAIELALDNCDLARLSTDYLGGAVDLSGSLSGQASLNGMGKALELLDGGGRLAIRNAEMYELPVMARLLKVLRNRVPDKTAFNGVDAQFDLDGKYIQFKELNLLGDAVSLYGMGVATFDRQLDLKFHSTVGRNDYNVPLLRSMIGQASANLLLIKVTGPMENAEVVPEPLPAVNEFVGQLGGEGPPAPRASRSFWNR